MIPAILIKRFGPTLAKMIFWAVAILLLVVILSVGKCVMDRGLKTEIKLGKNQTDAALKSGKDAVETLGNRTAAEAAAAANVQEARDAIDKANNVAGVTDAGLDGLRAVRRKAGDPGR